MKTTWKRAYKHVKIENGKNLRDVLNSISQQSSLEFKAFNRNIIVRRKSTQTTNLSTSPEPIRRITGRITARTDNSGLPGVNVLIKGSQIGTTTDIQGNYTLDATKNTAVLIFSSIGYQSVEVEVFEQSVVDVALSETIETLQEAVVTALGIETRKPNALGYSVGKVDGKDLDPCGAGKRAGGLIGAGTGGIN